jgi:N-acetylmuramoyl-L-alanine amidase
VENPKQSRKKSDLKNRLELMKNNPDGLFISIHLNKFTTSAARGSQVFYSSNDTFSKDLGEYIQFSIKNLIQPENTRVNKKATSSTFLLHHATIPAVLVECGFLSNNAELALLKQEDYQKKMAFAILCGINEFFSNKGDKNNYGI